MRRKVLSLSEFINQKYKTPIHEAVDPKAKIGAGAIVPDGAVLFSGDKYTSKDQNLADILSNFFTEDIPDFAKKFKMRQKDQDNFINLILTAKQNRNEDLLANFEVFLEVDNIGEERDREGELEGFIEDDSESVNFRRRGRFRGDGVKNNDFVTNVLGEIARKNLDGIHIPSKDITVLEFISPGVLGEKIKIKGKKDFEVAAEVLDYAVYISREL